ncbi:type 1 glutamine amidotransferase domain-containing protein [Roseateles sp. NT4]|uniref:type 1 glutamine amidotransferase domain-containing protein n=1 Tax=Roseateles sp. NT4 TaxID=3453715 RepID=UPI003EEBEF12
MKVLFVLTSNGFLGSTGQATGTWLSEFLVPYRYFVDRGIDVAVASVKGGDAPLDPSSVEAQKSTGTELDPQSKALLRNSLCLASNFAQLSDCDAIFFPGGSGGMWDFPDSEAVQWAVEYCLTNGKVVAALCHGVAGLVSARASSGDSVLHGRRVTGFSDAEELEIGRETVVPFLLESKLRQLGAEYRCASNWQPCVEIDGKLITGQNPASAAMLAEAVYSVLTR